MHTQYDAFMFKVIKHLIEAHVMHRELVRIEEAKVDKMAALCDSLLSEAGKASAYATDCRRWLARLLQFLCY